MTIDECECWDSEVHDAYVKSGEKFDPTKPSRRLHGGLVADLALYFKKGECYANKEKTISEWMSRDRAKDERLENATEPKGMKCLGCSSHLTNCISRDLMDDSTGNEQVLFMFECGKCNKKRAFWENGVEWEPRPTLCKNCNESMNSDSVRKGDIIETVSTCPKCHNQETDTFDLHVKEKPIDPDFERKRKKYCLSQKEGSEYITAAERLKQTTNLMKEAKEREENSEVYDAIAKIQKLTIAELQNLLNPLIENAGYAKLDLEKPDIQKDVVVGFGVQDTKSGRQEYDSIHELQRIIKKALEPTNWRLMSDGITYRLGYLQGRLNGVEGEENLKRLVAVRGSKR